MATANESSKPALLGLNGGAFNIPPECHREFQQDFERYYRRAERPYSDYAPAYEYGSEA